MTAAIPVAFNKPIPTTCMRPTIMEKAIANARLLQKRGLGVPYTPRGRRLLRSLNRKVFTSDLASSMPKPRTATRRRRAATM